MPDIDVDKSGEGTVSAGPPGPVSQSERIVSLDVLRGFAVLGILVMNIQSFSMIGAAYMNPTAYGDLNGLNYLVWFLSHVLFDKKFMAIFSMLFGAGIALMAERREAAGLGAASLHYRRMGILLVFGLAHAHLLWYGDILFAYSICGMAVFLFRRCRPGTLITLGVLSIAVGWLLSAFFQGTLQYWPAENLEQVSGFWFPSQGAVAEELAAYRGGFSSQLVQRIPMAFFMQTYVLLTQVVWRVGGLMLLGMALFKLAVFSAECSGKTYASMIAAALIVGVPLVVFGVTRNEAAGWNFESCFFAGTWFNYWASPVVSLGWVALVMLVCRRTVHGPATRRLAAAGQMALTNYLVQTIICTTIFYGHGFGLYGSVERWGQILIVFAVWVFQLMFSQWWLQRFRFGPFEWLWRSLSYMRVQPMRRAQ